MVRVHPQILDGQKLPSDVDRDNIWQHRYESIQHHELHLARNGTLILKFFLNVSRDEQKARFLSRLDEPHKNWKFAAGDVRERGFWPDYMTAYQDALNATSRSWAPWYAIPADDKPFMRMEVARIVAETLERLDLAYPEVDADRRAEFVRLRELLEND